MLKSRMEGGDTIVEVIVAIAIVSQVLAAAYVLSNHNVLTIQDSQEHSQAMQDIQSEIEMLKNADGAGITTSTSNCYDLDSSHSTFDKVVSNACTFNANGQYDSTTEPYYNLSVSSDGAAPPTPKLYTIAASWNDVFGHRGNVTMHYRTE